MEKSQRNSTIDLMKGVTIMLVIVGHFISLFYNDVTILKALRSVIYSFHMPLFFLLSGMFVKKGRFFKSVKRLLLPYFFTACLMFPIDCLLQNFDSISSAFFVNFSRMIIGSGYQHYGLYSQYSTPIIGAIWFLPALFFARIIYIQISKKINGVVLWVVVLLISVTSILIDTKLVYLPFSVLSGLSAIIFIHIGNKLNGGEVVVKPIWFLMSAFLTLITASFGELSVCCCIYPIYPLNIVGACAGTYMIYCICSVISKNKMMKKIFTWLGMNTLIILCMHNIQIMCSILLDFCWPLRLISMVAVPLLLTFLVTKSRFLKIAFGCSSEHLIRRSKVA